MAATPRRDTSPNTSPRIQGRRSPPGGRPAAGPPHRPRYPTASSSRHCSRGDTFHVPALPHLRQLEEVLVLDLALRCCTSGLPDAQAAYRPVHRCRRALPDRLAVAVPLCLSWPLSLLTAPELRPLDFLVHDRAWLRDHRPLHSSGFTTASSQVGHRLGLATLPQASSASVAAGPAPRVHGQPLRVDHAVTHATLHASLPLQGYYHPTVPVCHNAGERWAEGPRRDRPRLAQRRADVRGTPCGGRVMGGRSRGASPGVCVWFVHGHHRHRRGVRHNRPASVLSPGGKRLVAAGGQERRIDQLRAHHL